MNYKKMKKKGFGITYPKVFQNEIIWFLWKKFFCNRGWHLFDEVQSVNHYLYCDACEKTVLLKEE